MAMNTKVKGYALGAVAAATYGMNPLFALPLYQAGMSPDSVLFFRYLFAIPILAVMLRARGRSFGVARRDVPPLAAYGVLFSLSSLFLFLSYKYMASSLASTLLFVYPIMVALIMTLVFKERLTAQTVLCLAMALAGIYLLNEVSGGGTLSPAGVAYVMASSLSYAVYIVGINHCSLRNVPTIKVTFYVLLFGWGVYVARGLAGDGIHLPPADKWWLWLNLFALGLLPTAVSLLCTTTAIQCIGSTPTAILGALEPVTAVAIGLTVFGETLTPSNFVGLVLIVVAVSLVVAGGRISNHLVRFRKMFPGFRRRNK